MRVAVLGAGAIGFGGAAYLSQRGHDPILWSPSGRRTTELMEGKPLVATGAIEGQFRPRIARTCAEAVSEADVVFITLPANGHRMVFDAAAPHIRSGQTVVISGHLSFGALYLAKQLAERGVSAPIVAWGTTVTTGRQRSLTEVNVANVRSKVDVATVPVSAGDQGLAVCQTLFGDRFVPRADLLAIAVSNLNPQNHMGVSLLNLTRMERGETWGQNENLTEAVGRLLESLDAERLAIAKAIGVEVRTIREHYHLSFSVPMGSVGEMSRALHQRGDGTHGPKSLDTRYVLEDVPFGLVADGTVRPSGRCAGRLARIRHQSAVRHLWPRFPQRERPVAGTRFRSPHAFRPAGILPTGLRVLRRSRPEAIAVAKPELKGCARTMIKRTGPYEGLLHEVVEYNGVLYFAGVVAEDLSLDMAGQTADVLRQVDRLLALHGSNRKRILSAVLFVPDLALKPAMNEVWRQYFAPEDLPARATIGIGDLGPGVLLEMTLTAAAGDGSVGT